MGIVHAKVPEGGDEVSSREKINLDGINYAKKHQRLQFLQKRLREVKRRILFRKLKRVKARVDKIHVDGLCRTRDDVIVQLVKTLFRASDFQQVILAAHEVRMNLESLGCFKNIGIYIDTSQGPEASPDGLEITFNVSEVKRFVGGVNTLIGNNEGSLVVGARFPNMFGRGEKFQAEYTRGMKNSTGFNATFSKPLLNLKNASLTGAVYQQNNEFPWSGYRLTECGTLVNLWFESAPKVRHDLRWDGTWRELNCLSKANAFAVREETGHSLKSAIKHILTVDKRNNPIMPSTGVLFRLQQEYAGLGGDVGFVKHDLEFQANYPVINDFVLQAGINGGVMWRSSKNKSYFIMDRFFLGGPLTFRGFPNRGVGPHSEDCALGADVYWAGALHLYTPLPFRPGQGGFGDLFRLHMFVNAGNIGNFKFGNDYHENLTLLMNGLRWAYGAGIVLRLGQIARFELNYCLPMRAQIEDRVSPGLQFGVGVSYL